MNVMTLYVNNVNCIVTSLCFLLLHYVYSSIECYTTEDLRYFIGDDEKRKADEKKWIQRDTRAEEKSEDIRDLFWWWKDKKNVIVEIF